MFESWYLKSYIPCRTYGCTGAYAYHCIECGTIFYQCACGDASVDCWCGENKEEEEEQTEEGDYGDTEDTE